MARAGRTPRGTIKASAISRIPAEVPPRRRRVPSPTPGPSDWWEKSPEPLPVTTSGDCGWGHGGGLQPQALLSKTPRTDVLTDWIAPSSGAGAAAQKAAWG